MLDAFIIDRIRKERREHDSGLERARILPPSQDRWPPAPEVVPDIPPRPKRGVAIIDYSI